MALTLSQPFSPATNYTPLVLGLVKWKAWTLLAWQNMLSTNLMESAGQVNAYKFEETGRQFDWLKVCVPEKVDKQIKNVFASQMKEVMSSLFQQMTSLNI